MQGSRGVFAVAAAAMLSVGSARAACVVKQVAEMPITMEGLRPMIHVRMEGTDQRLLLDSGAFYSLLSPAVAAALKVKPRGQGEVRIGGVGGDVSARIGYVHSLSFGHVTMANVGFLIGGSETDGAGLLGQDILHSYDVEYDLSHGIVRLLRANDCAGQGLAYWASAGYAAIDVNPTTQYEPHTIGPVYVNGQRLRAMFDTGASTTVMTLGAAARLGVRPGGTAVVDAGYSSGIGRGMVRSWIAPFASFRIGQEEIRNIRLRFGDVGVEDFDLLVGSDFFLSHRVLISPTQKKLYFTYNGGPVFNLARGSDTAGGGAPINPPAAPLPPLQTAQDYARRGAVRASQRDLPGAVADLDQAIAKAPADAVLYAQRAALHRRMDRDALALADLDRSLRLRPNDAETLIERAELRLGRKEKDGALADLDRAATLAPRESNLRRQLGNLYSYADHFDQAIAQFDLWLDAHRQDNRQADALNGRCWARALAGKDLRRALDDCNAALYLAPKSADILDSRGLVRFRLGDLDQAMADYAAALAKEPETAWSLYGRSLIKRRRRDIVNADADRAAALKLDKEIEDRAGRYGITS